MPDFMSKNLMLILLGIAGALSGFLYWYFIGCLSGSCNITSVWYNSTAYGSVMGVLAGMIIKDVFIKKKSAPNSSK